MARQLSAVCGRRQLTDDRLTKEGPMMKTNAQCPMPNALQCPMPNAQCPTMPNAQCSMLNVRHSKRSFVSNFEVFLRYVARLGPYAVVRGSGWLHSFSWRSARCCLEREWTSVRLDWHTVISLQTVTVTSVSVSKVALHKLLIRCVVLIACGDA